MIAVVIIIIEGSLENLMVPLASRLQNDSTMFILPVYYNHFSYFILISFLWEIKTCCCCNNYNNDNSDNDASMVTRYWETIEIAFENLLCNLIFHH